jgi:hypothetical protein
MRNSAATVMACDSHAPVMSSTITAGAGASDW